MSLLRGREGDILYRLVFEDLQNHAMLTFSWFFVFPSEAFHM